MNVFSQTPPANANRSIPAVSPSAMPQLQRPASGSSRTVPVAMPSLSLAQTQSSQARGFTMPAPKPAAMPTLSRPAETNRIVTIWLACDESSSMGGSKSQAMIRAVQAFEKELAAVPANRFRIGVVGFSSSARLIEDLRPVSGAAQALPFQASGSTNIREALEIIEPELQTQHKTDIAAGMNPREVVLLLSDGGHNVGPFPDQVALSIKAENTTIITVAFGADADLAALARLATSPAHCYLASDAAALIAFFRKVGRTLSQSAVAGANINRALGTI